MKLSDARNHKNQVGQEVIRAFFKALDKGIEMGRVLPLKEPEVLFYPPTGAGPGTVKAYILVQGYVAEQVTITTFDGRRWEEMIFSVWPEEGQAMARLLQQ